MTKEYITKWRSPAAEARFRAIEDELWAEHARHPEPVDEETPRGTTRAYHWPGSGDPILFLHGIGGTSLLWAEYADRLVGHDVLSIDIRGDAGGGGEPTPFFGPA